MANWLGRLGAIVSNFFFYYLFGLPSYLIIYIMVLLGLDLSARAPLSVYWLRIRYALVIMLSLAVLLDSFFQALPFPGVGRRK
ncbi:MAG: DNA translocase FtsK 4TM domain-containing protein [Saprospirales bacterium]|nr:DNA translocase FtsK 4TM domain-containing protein [Saprospirales bacterium]